MSAMSCLTGPIQMPVVSSGTSAVGRFEGVNTLWPLVENFSNGCRSLTSAEMPLQSHVMFALLQTFPDIDEMYKQRTLTRLLEKEQWAVAATYAGQDTQCQVRDFMLQAHSKIVYVAQAVTLLTYRMFCIV